MSHVDREAVIDSMKVLGILFIMAISTSSLALLIKLIRLQENVFNLRRIMVIILTCGTLLFSLFPLVVTVRVQFQPMKVTCNTRVLSSVYENFYFPFVYALSLMAMALELYTTKRGSSNLLSTPIRIIYIILPWIVGCILVLPLTLSGVNWDYDCSGDFTLARHRSILWLCNLLPAIAVLLVAIFLAFKVGGDNNRYAHDPTVTSSSSTQRVVHSSSSSSSYGFQQAGYNTNHPTGMVMASAPQSQQQRPDSGHFNQPPYDYSSSPPSYHIAAYQSHQPHHHQHQQFQHPSVDIKPYQHHHHHHHHHHQPPPQYPPPPPPNYAPPPPGFGTPFYEFDHNVAPHNRHHHHHHHPHHQNTPQASFSQPQITSGSHTNTNTREATPAAPTFRDLRNEAKTFAKVAALFVFCSLPQAIYNLAYRMNESRVQMDEMSETVISHLVSWLTILRWLLLIICWFVSIN